MNKIISQLKKLKDLPPLFFRLVLAYGFYGPATMKLKNFEGIVEWFTGMGMPLPKLNAFLATRYRNCRIHFIIFRTCY